MPYFYSKSKRELDCLLRRWTGPKTKTRKCAKPTFLAEPHIFPLCIGLQDRAHNTEQAKVSGLVFKVLLKFLILELR